MKTNPAAAYIPIDRRNALGNAQTLPTAGDGVALFVDISGFTPLTNALRRCYGPRRGAEELTRHLNAVYTKLIGQVEQYAGSVIGFSGDAITCWFAAPATTDTITSQAIDTGAIDTGAINTRKTDSGAMNTRKTDSGELNEVALRRAITAALQIQQQMQALQAIQLEDGGAVPLAVKTAIAAGPARRFVVGDPAIQCIDVLAGSTIDRMAATEQVAHEGELVIDAPTVAVLADQLTIDEWRTDENARHYAVVSALQSLAAASPWPPERALDDELLHSWVLPAIVARLQSDQGRFLAELRPAAALFLKFTGLDYDHDSTVVQKLDGFVRWVQRVVERQEGALIQFTTGDKGSYLYAAFGAPIAHDDDIQRAVAVANVLRRAPEEHPFIEQVQIGVSYGTMRVGAYGSESRRTYGVLGNETNMAARFMTHAAPGQIVVNQVVATALAGQYALQPLGEVMLKGRAEPQRLFALADQQQQQIHRKLYTTSLVGRQSELAALQQCATHLQAGTGGIARIVGEAGIGKSHLVATFADAVQRKSVTGRAATNRAATNSGIRVIRGAGQSTTQDTPYFALRQAMHELLDLDQDASISRQRKLEQIAATLEHGNPSWHLRLPLLGDLLGIAIPDNATTAAFDARLRQEALTTLTLELFQHHAENQPLLLLIEDIHWLDEASQSMLLALARLAPTVPILLVLVHRPPVHDGLRGQARFLDHVAELPTTLLLNLEELLPTGIVELVQERLGGSVSSLAAALVQVQAQGNPFFTEELVDALLESEQLQQIDDVWQLTPALVTKLRSAGCLQGRAGAERLRHDAPLAEIDLGIPTTIQGIILARLDRLPESVKLTVKVASVIGRIFAQELLHHAHPRQPAASELGEEVATLLARDFARLETPDPHPSYIFKHNITQEVVYQTLLTDQRQELHLGVATAVEALQPESVDALALHYYHSHLETPAIRSKALHYLDAAGQRAKHDYANETALTYFQRALGLEMRAAWLQAQVEILHTLGRREEEAAALATLATAADAEPGEVALLQSSYHEALSDYGSAQAQVEQALTHFRAEADRRGEVRCLSQLGVVLARQAHYQPAQSYYEQALQLAERNQWDEEQAHLLYGLNIVNRSQGNYQSAQSQVEAALTLYHKAENRQGEARMLTGLGVLAHMQRDYATAEDYYQQALQIQQLIGDRSGEAGSLMSLGQAIRSRGDFGKAAVILEEATAIFAALGNRWWEKIGYNELGIIALFTGSLSGAAEYFNDSLRLSQNVGDTSGEAIALLNLGQAKREQANNVQARELIERSKQMLEAQGDRYLQALCWSDLALCALRLHQPRRAIDDAQSALALYRELDITSALPAEFCTLAEAHAQLCEEKEALAQIQQALQRLAEIDLEEPDYPQRDYFTCYQILATYGQDEAAQQALAEAHAILQTKAARISDPAMRASFLENVAFNREIVVAAAQQGLVGG